MGTTLMESPPWAARRWAVAEMADRVGAGRRRNGEPAVSLSARRSFEERLDVAAASSLSMRGMVRIYRAGEVAFLQGERPGRVAVVVEGVVKVTATSEDGRSTILDLRDVGDGVGLMEALDEGPRTSTVTALSTAALRLMTADDFADFLARHPSAREAAAAVLADRVRRAVDDRLRSTDPVPIRLASCLLRLAADHGDRRDDDTFVIDLPLSQDDLAMIVCTSRDSVAKTLMVWRRQHIVETSRRCITILDPVRLEESA